MAVLKDAGATGLSVSDYVDARESGRPLPEGAVVLTFDDGYLDFAEIAAPILQAAKWRGTVFLPVHPIESGVPWDCGDGHRRPLLTWAAVRELAAFGIEFGAHTLTHSDLTRLTADRAAQEISKCGIWIRERAGCMVNGFAPPFGRSTFAIRQEIARHYRWSVGVRMGSANGSAELFDLPRIDMWYFRNIGRWRRYVAKGWTPYFEWRRTWRALKQSL
jgi:peptidoglycan/xylan/chitin deacetylase (PgdA/CDA1 family)